MAKATKKPRKSSFCTPGSMSSCAQRVEGERALAQLAGAHHVQADDGGQHDQPADQAVEEELHRGVLPARPAEAADQEVHRDEHRLEEDVEQEDVGGGEDADHHRLEQQQPGEVAPSIGRGVPSAGRSSCQEAPMTTRHEHADEQQHHQRDAVDAEGEGDPEVGDPGHRGGQLEPLAAGVEGDGRPGRRARRTTRLTPSATCRASSSRPRGSAATTAAPTAGTAIIASEEREVTQWLACARLGALRPGSPFVAGLAHPDVTASRAPATSTAPPSMPRA